MKAQFRKNNQVVLFQDDAKIDPSKGRVFDVPPELEGKELALYRDKEAKTVTLVEADFDASTAKAKKVAEIATARYNHEVGGFTIADTGTALDGAFIRTDREVSQAKINAVVTACILDPNYTTPWGMVDGSRVTLNKDEINLIAVLFGQHEKAGRVKADTLLTQLEAATTKEDVQAITWAS